MNLFGQRLVNNVVRSQSMYTCGMTLFHCYVSMSNLELWEQREFSETRL